MVAVIWIGGFGALIPTWLGMWGIFGLDVTIGSCSILPDSEMPVSERNAVCRRICSAKFIHYGFPDDIENPVLEHYNERARHHERNMMTSNRHTQRLNQPSRKAVAKRSLYLHFFFERP